MKKKLILFLIVAISFSLISCKNDSNLTTIKSEATISEIVSTSSNPFNIGLFMTDTPTTSMGINFELNMDVEASVKYVEILGSDMQSVQATRKTRMIGKKQAFLYEAQLVNLQAGKTYSYFIESNDGSIRSSSYTFSMPENSSDGFTFMYIADPQENTGAGYMAYAYSILNVLDFSNQNFDFVMYPGDLVNDVDVKSEWDWFYQYSSSFITSKPIVATLGNHEGGGIDTDHMTSLEFDGYLNLPNNGPQYDTFDELPGDLRESNFDDGKTYRFDYGNARFVVIDTEIYCDGTTTCSQYDESNAQILNDWVETQFNTNTQNWLIVLLHRGPYSLSYNTVSVRNNLVPLFEKYNVDLVLSGHDHQYSRAVYNQNEMIPFSTSNTYFKGIIELDTTSTLNYNFNQYSSSIGITYLTGSTVATKFYGGSKNSGIDVQYKFVDENPVIPFITVTEDKISVISYGVSKENAFAIVPSGVYVLEEFTITK